RRRQRFDDLLKELPEAAARPDLDAVAGRLRGLVQTPDEEQRLREAVRAWEQQRQQRDLAAEQKLRARLDELDRQTTELEKLLEQPRREDEARDRLAGLDREVRRLEGEVKGVSNELHAAARGLDGRLGRARKELEERRAEAGLLQELTASLQDARSVTPFVEGLARYAKRFPESARGRSFRRAVDEERVWEGVLAWNQLLGPTFAQPLELSAAEAKVLAGKCEQFLKSFPQFPDARTATDYQRAVAAVALRDHDNKS